MRDIKFRAKCYTGKWRYGSLCERKFFDFTEEGQKFRNCYSISEGELDWTSSTGYAYREYMVVLNETIGQFTGLKDKNGKEIYEGDIVRGKDYTGLRREGRVVYDEREAKYVIVPDTKSEYRETESIEDLCPADEYLEVVGNIWDNPEMIKEGK